MVLAQVAAVVIGFDLMTSMAMVNGYVMAVANLSPEMVSNYYNMPSTGDSKMH